MTQVSKLLDDSVVKLAQQSLSILGKQAYLARKLQAVIAAKKHGISKVSEVYDISRVTLTSWTKHLRSGKVDKLLAPPERRKKSKLNDAHRITIAGWIKDNSQLTIIQLTKKTKSEFGLAISKSTVHREVKKLNFSYITARPKHFKQDSDKVAEFKKNVSSKIQEANATKVMFFDEARFGTHSRRGYGWFIRGTRPVVITKIGYQNFYLYGAISVNGGDNFSLILPSINVDCMNLYLAQLSLEYTQDIIALIMDGAGWHKAKDLKVPGNIKIIYLPPYSPELNPIERLWLYIKSKVLNNKMYDKLDDLELALCAFIQSLKNEQVSSLCTANYLLN